MLNQRQALENFRRLPPVEPQELDGLWKGHGIPTGHPLDGVLENLGWFGKRFTPDMCADALLFQFSPLQLTPIDPARIPLRLALRLHGLGRTWMARSLFSAFHRSLRARGHTASLQTVEFERTVSTAMIYDSQPIVDHFRRMSEKRIAGVMTVEGDERRYFFELERIDDVSVRSLA
ncbi:DUF4334 domain-containing protein [Neorhizobium petrolearium]|uniref:DUF4334 domain-containing protein n=1 Tax=Neorhizobium petrolearium TaxID=515361 RepID=UPI003F5CCB26